MSPLSADGLLRYFFGQGWWSVGLVLTSLVGYGAPYFWAARIGETGIKRDVTLFVLILAGPLLAFVYLEILGAVADPEPGCIEECWGRLGLGALAVLGFIAWEAGLAFGCLRRFMKSRRLNSDDRMAK